MAIVTGTVPLFANSTLRRARSPVDLVRLATATEIAGSSTLTTDAPAGIGFDGSVTVGPGCGADFGAPPWRHKTRPVTKINAKTGPIVRSHPAAFRRICSRHERCDDLADPAGTGAAAGASTLAPLASSLRIV